MSGRLALALLCLTMMSGACNRPPERPENVLLIVVDTLRADHFGREHMPELHRWFDEGRHFERVWSAGGWTPPGTAALMTGRVGVGLDNDGRDGFMGIPADEFTFAELAQRNQLRTAIFSENGVLEGLQEGSYGDTLGYGQGFERAHLSGGEVLEMALRWIDGENVREGEGRFPESVDRRQPWFLHLQTIAVHDYWGSDEIGLTMEHIHQIADTCQHVDTQQCRTDRQQFADAYALAARRSSLRLATFLRALEDRRLLENTLVVVTSDHGEALGEHDAIEGGFRLSHPPGALWNETTHIPLAVRGPGIEAGVSQQTLSQAHIYPAMARVLGWAIPDHIDPGPGFHGTVEDVVVPMADCSGPGAGTAGAIRYPLKVTLSGDGHRTQTRIDGPSDRLATRGDFPDPPRRPACAALSAEEEERLRALNYVAQ